MLYRLTIELMIGPVIMVENGRVAIGGPVGEILGVDVAAVSIGERPGLSAPDSLGCSITWQSRRGLPDSRRNCVSNVRRAGLSYKATAGKIAYLITEARRRPISGVTLKEDAPPLFDEAPKAARIRHDFE